MKSVSGDNWCPHGSTCDQLETLGKRCTSSFIAQVETSCPFVLFQVAALCVLLALANAAPRPDDDSAETLPFVATLKDVRVQPDALGVHSLDFEAENGIAVKTVGSHGSEGGSVMQGAFNYRLDDGTFVPLTFVADEFGYRPVSDLLPVAPLPLHPVPQHALDQIAFAEQQRRAQDSDENDS
ncbi:pupal cuticle protein-like [Oratosquilla oratoria]|uniref:pupal cuticle protein-like n=1 Tax=Oratosquilla oratoria TaxID=337810 RepID=UPI003F768E54